MKIINNKLFINQNEKNSYFSHSPGMRRIDER